MASKPSTCLFACVILFFVQSNAAKSLVPKCDYACRDDVEIEASGSAISSQFVQPDGSVITHSKGTVYSSDGIKQTFHELKKEADKFVQTGHSNFAIPPIPTFGNIPVPAVPVGPYFNLPSHESFSQTNKDKIIHTLTPSSSSQVDNFQAHNNVHTHSNSEIPCTICTIHSGANSGKSEATASYNTIVGNAPITSGSSYSRYESSMQQKNATQQAQPMLFANSPKTNTFTTNFIDLNSNYNNHGHGSETQIDYQETGSGQIKTEEHIGYGLGPISRPSKVVVEVSGPSSAGHSTSYQKQESSSHVEQTAASAPAVPVSVFVQQAEAELAAKQQQQNQINGFYSPVIYKGVPQSVPLESQQAGSHQSSHYYSSSSSSKTVSSSGGSSPAVVPIVPVVVQSPPQKYVSSSSGYNSGSSISSSSHSQNPSEFYYNGQKIHGASSSIYDNSRGDSNAETLCTTNCQPCPTCYVSAGAPVKNFHGVSTSYSSQSSTINGKTTENREAAVSVNDNGKVDSYHVKTP